MNEHTVRYDLRALLRFLALSIPVLLLTLGLGHFVADMVGIDTGPSLGSNEALPAVYAVSAWLLEAVALTSLFLLVAGRTSARILDGLFTGLCAWLFRGPVLVLTIASMPRTRIDGLWAASWVWLGLYLLCGCLLAWLGRRLETK